MSICKKKLFFSAEDVGIIELLNEKIISARFVDDNPTYCYETSRFEEIKELLETLRNAEFRPHSGKTEGALFAGQDCVIIQTEENRYVVGYSFAVDGSGVFFRAGDECGHYDCSAEREFRGKLCEIKGQKNFWT